MINTEIFYVYNRSNYDCFDEALKEVNDLIREEGIDRKDILEYHTKNWETVVDNEIMWHYEVTISYWQDKKE